MVVAKIQIVDNHDIVKRCELFRKSSFVSIGYKQKKMYLCSRNINNVQRTHYIIAVLVAAGNLGTPLTDITAERPGV